MATALLRGVCGILVTRPVLIPVRDGHEMKRPKLILLTGLSSVFSSWFMLVLAIKKDSALRSVMADFKLAELLDRK